MAKAISIEFLRIYPPSLLGVIERIMKSGEFKPASLPIGEKEKPIRGLNPLEMALFTVLADVREKHNAISSAYSISPLEKILLADYAEQYKFFDKLLIEGIILDLAMDDISADRIGIREGHIIVLLPEKNIDFTFPLFQPDCMQCVKYSDCNHPDKMFL